MYNAYGGWQAPQMAPQQVIRVNGENGARALNLPANSSALVLDETAPLVWLCTTDGAGYKTVTPYSISEYKPAQMPTTAELLERINRLEARFNESDSRRDEQQAKQPSERDVRRIQESRKS